MKYFITSDCHVHCQKCSPKFVKKCTQNSKESHRKNQCVHRVHIKLHPFFANQNSEVTYADLPKHSTVSSSTCKFRFMPRQSTSQQRLERPPLYRVQYTTGMLSYDLPNRDQTQITSKTITQAAVKYQHSATRASLPEICSTEIDGGPRAAAMFVILNILTTTTTIVIGERAKLRINTTKLQLQL